MYIFLPPAKCSACGSERSESFSDYQRHGIRCKDCGHEKSQPQPWVQMREQGIAGGWALSDAQRTF